MADSVYRVTEVIGVSGESWDAAARNAVETAAKTVRDLRVAEVIRQDVTIENGSLVNYRVRLGISSTCAPGAGRGRGCARPAPARGRRGPDARSYPPASRAARSNSSKPWRMSCWL